MAILPHLLNIWAKSLFKDLGKFLSAPAALCLSSIACCPWEEGAKFLDSSICPSSLYLSLVFLQGLEPLLHGGTGES